MLAYTTPGGQPPYPAAALWPWSDLLDAVAAALRFHRVDRVRVLEMAVGPHQREPVHTHCWPSALRKEQADKGGNRYDGPLIY